MSEKQEVVLKFKVYGLRPDRRYIGTWKDRTLAIDIARDLTRTRRRTQEARDYHVYPAAEVWEEQYVGEFPNDHFVRERPIFTREGRKEWETP